MTTPTTPSPMQIHIASTPVRLTAKLEGEAFDLLYGDIPLSQHGDRVSIQRDSAAPAEVKVEILDFAGADGHWTLTASVESAPWARGEGLCHTAWTETDGVVAVAVTATNAAGVSRHKPVFIEVPPKDIRPWP